MRPQLTTPEPRRRNRILPRAILVTALLAACALGFAAGAAQTPPEGGARPAEERELENTIPAHVPIKVRVKNWEKVKDLKNKDWYGDLEVEVTNSGSKPIYLLVMSLLMPEIKAESGAVIGQQLRYGRTGFTNLSEPVRPDDVALRPGESIVLKVPERNVKGWKLYKAEKHFPDPKKIRLQILFVSFGDGTGFVTTGGLPVPSAESD